MDLRKWLGSSILIAGMVLMVAQAWAYVRGNPVVWNALIVGSVAVLATALGALRYCFLRGFRIACKTC